jgi:hypothetical protein
MRLFLKGYFAVIGGQEELGGSQECGHGEMLVLSHGRAKSITGFVL